MHFYTSESTLDNLKSVFNVFRRKPSLSAPDSKSFRCKLKQWDCTKISTTSSIVCARTRKTFGVNILLSLSQVSKNFYTSSLSRKLGREQKRGRLGWIVSYNSLYFVDPSIEKVPLFAGVRESISIKTPCITVTPFSVVKELPASFATMLNAPIIHCAILLDRSQSRFPFSTKPLRRLGTRFLNR